jgi:hypothetical protein
MVILISGLKIHVIPFLWSAHKIIGAKANILKVLFGVLMECFIQ